MRRSAFTLTELLVVIGIAVLVMAMGAVSLRDAFKNTRLKGAATSLQAAIMQTRNLAVVMTGTYYGYFNRTAGTYGAYSQSGGSDVYLQGQKVIFPSGIGVQTPSANGEITFRPDGTITWSWLGTDYSLSDVPANADIKLEEVRPGTFTAVPNAKAAYFDLVKNTGAVRFGIQ